MLCAEGEMEMEGRTDFSPLQAWGPDGDNVDSHGASSHKSGKRLHLDDLRFFFTFNHYSALKSATKLLSMLNQAVSHGF